MSSSKAHAHAKARAYARRFEKVFDYIDRHHDEALTVDTLSRIAHFSRFHFHRQFTDYCGITVSRYIQLVRMRRASYRLVFNPLERIADIALDAGFDSPEAFSRAFKQVFGQTPSGFRAQPHWEAWTAHYQFPPRTRSTSMNVTIVNIDPIQVAVLEHHGDQARIMASAQRFIEWRKTTGLSPIDRSRTFGIPYGDPDRMAAEEFRFDICGSVTEPVPANAFGVTNTVIPGGRCAVARHLGSRDEIATTVYHLYRDWLPGSGEECRDFPVFFEYLNLEPATPQHELITDVYLPLK